MSPLHLNAIEFIPYLSPIPYLNSFLLFPCYYWQLHPPSEPNSKLLSQLWLPLLLHPSFWEPKQKPPSVLLSLRSSDSIFEEFLQMEAWSMVVMGRGCGVRVPGILLISGPSHLVPP